MNRSICGTGTTQNEYKTGQTTVLSPNCLTLNLPTHTFQRKTVYPGLCRVLNYSLSAPNPPFYCTAWNSADTTLWHGTLQIFLLCQLPAIRLYQQGFLEGDGLAEEITVLRLLSKSGHFTMAIGVVLISSIYLIRFHPPDRLITF